MNDFTDELQSASISISMDGRGRVFDNIFVERLWHTVKYEDIYIKEYATVPDLPADSMITSNSTTMIGRTRASATACRLMFILI